MNKLRNTFILLFIVSTTLIYGQNLQQKLGSQINITVAADGSGDFTTITDAINFVSKNASTRTVIFVKKGTYTEKLEVENGINKVTLVGEDLDSTILVYDDYSGSGESYNGIMTSRIGDAIGTSTSHTMYIDSDEFILMNMTVVNNAGPVGQAVAMNLGGDRTILIHCRILGNQDTFYTWGYGRFLMKDCFIEGNVDFIFGRGVALFDSCIINTNRSSCQITAASTDENWKFGYVFQNCKITGNYGVSGVSLGRPWKTYAQTVFMSSHLGKHITSFGWTDWDGRSSTCYYAEYNNDGPGFVPDSRVSWSHQLTDTEAANYTMANMFAKNANPSNFSSNWNPNIHSDPVYKVLKANTSLLYTDSLQNNAQLQFIKIDDVEIEDFDPTTKTYYVELTDSTTIPALTVDPFSDKASVVIENPEEIPGNAAITITAINGFSMTYVIRYRIAVGIEEVKSKSFNIDIINSIFDNELRLKAAVSDNKMPLEVSLYSVTGKKVLYKVVEKVNNNEIVNIKTSNINPGMYICCIKQGNKYIQKKVLKI